MKTLSLTFLSLFVFGFVAAQEAVTIMPGGRITYGSNTAHKKLVLWGEKENDHQFFGLGIEPAILRYQTDTTWSDHVFFSGINSSSSRELFRIKGNGNIGIDNPLPNAPLQFSNAVVNRKIVMYEGGNNNHQYYGFGVNGGVLRYQTDAPWGDHVFYSAINENSSKELFRIGGSGRVSIDFAESNGGNLSSNALIFGGSSSAEGISSKRTIGGNRYGLDFYTNGGNRLSITNGGNVGIGTSTPTTKLEVNGFTKLGSDAPAIKHKLLTGNTATTEGGLVSQVHGLSDAKIVSVTVLVVSLSGSQTHVPPGYPVVGLQYSFFVENGSVYIRNTAASSSAILNKPYKVFITYQE